MGDQTGIQNIWIPNSNNKDFRPFLMKVYLTKESVQEVKADSKQQLEILQKD